MRLDDDTYEYIKREVVDLFERYDVKCIPISGYELALKMGIVLIPYSSLSKKKWSSAMEVSEDGFFLEIDNVKECIYYNDAIDYERSNMTILHEIGHIVLGHTSDMDSDVMESEAAFFAKYAAAPPPLVHRIRPECVEDIQYLFNVSFTAACYAYDYYLKWLRKYMATGEMTGYEKRMLRLFSTDTKGVINM